MPRNTTTHPLLLLLLLLAPLLACTASASLFPLNVTVSLGELEGVTDGETVQWRSIPFARPPVGALRFKPPEEAKPWSGRRAAVSWPPSCPQNDAKGTYGEQSEDCLYLNVARPAAEGTLPILVWIYGGAFHSGGTSLFLYNPSRLAVRAGGAVVVTLNYRLGALGFLTLAGTEAESSNVGLLDQRAAMKFVHENAAAFGGDPSRVTLFGESAGAISTSAHTAMPASYPYFTRSIQESGDGLMGNVAGKPNTKPYFSLDQGRSVTSAVSAAVGCGSGTSGVLPLTSAQVTCLRDVAVADLLNAQKGLHWSPQVDNVTLEGPLSVYAAGRQAPGEQIVGINKNDGTMFAGAVNMSVAYHAAQLEAIFGKANAAQVNAQFPLSDYASPFDASAAVVTSSFFDCPSRRQLLLSRNSSRVYFYVYDHLPSWVSTPGGVWADRRPLGVAHTYELFSVWGHPLPYAPFTAGEEALSKDMGDAWVNFATSGAPGGGWEPFGSSQAYARWNVTGATMMSGYNAAACAFWDSMTVV